MATAPGTPITKEGVGSPKAPMKVKASPKKAPMKAFVKAVASPKKVPMKAAVKAVASPKKSAMKAKAKAKASGKAKAKVAKSDVKSSKESAGKDDEGDGNPLKRPAAAAKGSIKDLNKRLLEAATCSDKGEDQEEEEEEELGEEGEDAEEEDADEPRDRCKKQKFDTLLAQNKLPGHITDMWFKGVQNEKNKRGFKTKIINALFERDSKGKLIMRPEAPFFSFLQADSREKVFWG